MSWKAPGNGIATVDTIGSGFDTLLTVFTEDLTPIATDDDSGGFLTSLLWFNAVKDQVYRIAIDGFEGVEGEIITHWKFEATDEPVPVLLKQPEDLTVLA